jgi:short subunit dehydrogenase-like uncharacterized protein
MPEVLLFGATGYTGRLTAHALKTRGVSFAIAGRNRSKLEALAAEVGDPPIRIAEAGDTSGLVKALDGCKVLITCVGPFVEMGDTAVEAALEAGVHYIDSTGEGTFIAKLIERDADAHSAGIAMAPAMGFDEVPGDVAATLACEGMANAELHVTYAVPRTASLGTIRSTLGIVTSEGPWIEDGRARMIRAGEETRWAPLPPPLGPKRAVSFPLALGHLAPRHLDLRDLRLYVTAGAVEGNAMKFGVPFLRWTLDSPARPWIDKVVDRAPEGPTESERDRSWWTILAEARSGSEWRNVTLQGTDYYGLTAETLTAAAIQMSAAGYDVSGVVAPVQAVGRDVLLDEISKHGVSIETYAPV